MNNLPAGVTPREIDHLCRPDDSFPNRHDCILCSRQIEQDDDTRWWFFSDEFTSYKPTHRADFTDAFETHAGWVCGTSCWNDYAIDAEEKCDRCDGTGLTRDFDTCSYCSDGSNKLEPRPRLQLVKGRTA